MPQLLGILKKKTHPITIFMKIDVEKKSAGPPETVMLAA